MMNNYLKYIKNMREKKDFTISCAESCTGGMISSYLTSLDGSSNFFEGSLITYSNKLKIKLLKVSNKTISNYGAVSHQTALEMVRGLSKKCKSNLLVSVTGVAGPSGGSKETPVGCVYFGFGKKINNKYKFKTIKKQFNEKNRKKIQLKSTEFVLKKICFELRSI